MQRGIRVLGGVVRLADSQTVIGYGGESLIDAEARMEAVWQLGAMPFAQLYQPADGEMDYDCEWRALARTWCRPAAMMAMHGGNNE